MRIFLLFLFFKTTTVFAAINKDSVDSIKVLLTASLKNGNHPDTLTINRLNKLAGDYFKYNTDSSLYYAKKGISLSQKINYKKGIAYGLLQTGYIGFFKGDFAGARRDFDSAILLLKQVHDKVGLAKCYLFYGRLYNLYGDHKQANDYFNKSLILNREVSNEIEIADCYKNIGNSYYSEGKLSQALEFYYKALFLEIKNNNQLGMPGDYNDIGNVLQDLEMLPSALNYFNKALKLFRVNNDQVGIETVLENIGEILYFEDKYYAAISNLEKSLQIAERQDDKEGICLVYSDLGLCYQKINQPSRALFFLQKSLETAVDFKISNCEANTSVSFAQVYNLQGKYDLASKYAVKGQKLAAKLGNLRVAVNAALQLNIALAAMGQYKSAYEMLLKYKILKDSLHNDESLQKLTSRDLELDFNEKEHQLKIRQHEKEESFKQRIVQQKFVIAISLILILALVGVSLVYYRQKLKQQKVNLMLGEKNKEVLEQKSDLDEQAGKLNDLNTLKDRLISILAHDLRAPLSTLRGLFSLLQDDTISHQQMLDMIPGVLKKLEYTSDFLDTLLFWINSQMENFENTARKFLIKDIVSFETQNYQEQASIKGIKLIDNVPDYLTAAADPNSIRIVLRNLITNAIKFSKENDRIEINAGNYDSDAQIISVTDTGAGINNEDLSKLFKSKVNSKAGTQNETGTGMGLLFCKDLVEKFNGKIWVTSSPGSGTTFSFTIPATRVNEGDMELFQQ